MQDTFLVSQMDGELFVPLVVIAGFNRIRQLTQEDNSLLLDVIEESDECELDSTKQRVRPAFVVMRTVILVEGAPRGVELTEVRAHVATGPCGDPTAAGVEVDGSFAFAFADEETASSAVEFVNTAKFRKTVALTARTKLDTSFKTQGAQMMGAYPQAMGMDPALAAAAASNPYLAYYMSYGAYMNPYAMGNAAAAGGDTTGFGFPGMVPGADFGGNYGGGNRRGGLPYGQGPPRRGGRGNGGRGGNPYSAPGGVAPAPAQRGSPATARPAAGRGADASKAAPAASKTAASRTTAPAPKAGRDGSRQTKPDVNFTPNDFPALPAAAGAKSSSGYTQQFKKYERGSLLDILRGLKGNPPKEKLDASSEAVADILAPEPQDPLILTPFPKATARPKTAADVAKATAPTPSPPAVEEPSAPTPTPAAEAKAPQVASSAPSTSAPAPRAAEKSGAPTWASIAQKKDES